jgi:predicted membrane channel-forming protein YqfA (hemolysin III family)
VSAIAEPRAGARRGFFEPIPPISFPSLWRTDTRSIVGSVLLAVAFSANMQITERLDTATVGGIIPWTALPFGVMWFTAACFFFGMTGGLIAASFNPIIAILTATGPLAPVHFTINWSFCIPMALMAAYVLRKNKPISYRTYLIMVMVSVAAIATSLIPVWLFLFKFSLPQVAGLWLWAVAEGLPGSILGFLFVRSVAKSGVLSA